MHIATISSKRQITLPKKMLDELGLEANKRVLITKEKDVIKLRPVKKSMTDELAGSLTKYVDPSKLGVPFSKIREETQRLAAKEIVEKWSKKE